jgi:hypothetical protein
VPTWRKEVASGALLPFGQRALLYAPTELIEPFTFTSVAPCCSRLNVVRVPSDPTMLNSAMCVSLCQVNPAQVVPSFPPVTPP